MFYIEMLLNKEKHKHLQKVFRIIPFTTVNYDRGAILSEVPDNIIEEDIENAESFVKQPNAILLGWQNQKTKEDEYAIGGGIVSNPSESQVKQQKRFQACLIGLSKQYGNPKKSTKPEAKTLKETVKETVKEKSNTLDKKTEDSEILVATRVQGSMPSKPGSGITMPLIRRGNLEGTFKIAFRDSGSAKHFYAYLKKAMKIKNGNQLTYFAGSDGDGEKYPMNESGQVVSRGEYGHIIRFEPQPDADALKSLVLEYFKNIKINDPAQHFDAIMSRTPDLGLRLPGT